LPKAALEAPGQIYELITPFEPEPLIEIIRQQGFAAWSYREESELVKTYCYRPVSE